MGKTSRINLVGQTFGLLTAVSEVPERDKHGFIYYNVVCECGNTKKVLGASLRRGASRACSKCQFIIKGTHGMWKTKVFQVWTSMKDRCLNSKSPNYKNYGGRGITICDRWLHSFETFYADMGEPDGLTLDRIDVNEGYSFSNCRWATPKKQSRNKTNNRTYSYGGETKCYSEWCEFLNMPSSTFHNRIKRGWSISKIVETPIRNKTTL